MTEKNDKAEALIDELLKDSKGSQDILSLEGLLGDLTKRSFVARHAWPRVLFLPR